MQHDSLYAWILGGKPRLVGRRISVQHIVVDHLNHGRTIDDICEDYQLDSQQVHETLDYYNSHHAEVDNRILSGELYIEKMRKATLSLLSKALRERELSVI